MSADDDRWLVIDGRRWRRTDPLLDEEVAARLRSLLGSARSAVRLARSAGDVEAERAARRRVQLAKEGLGERGTPWWELDDRARLERAASAIERLE